MAPMQLRNPRPRRLALSLTPLIDVVFILLVFFLLSSSFTQWNALSLEISPTTRPSSAQAPETSNVQLTESSPRLDSKDMQFPAVLQTLQERLRQNPQHIVRVEPESLLPLQDLVIQLKQLQHIAGPNLVLVKQPSHTNSQ